MAAAQLIAETQASVPVAGVPPPAQTQIKAEDAAESTTMEVDSVASADGRSKRKADDEGTPESSKKARVGESVTVVIHFLVFLLTELLSRGTGEAEEVCALARFTWVQYN